MHMETVLLVDQAFIGHAMWDSYAWQTDGRICDYKDLGCDFVWYQLLHTL